VPRYGTPVGVFVYPVRTLLRRTATRLLVPLVAAAFSGVSCRTASTSEPAASPPIVQPGAPGEASRVVSAAQATDLSKVQFTRADVEFMQGMIGHHSQAVEMVDLLKTHTASGDMRKLGQRIELSQVDEIKMMQRWLEVRGQKVPGIHDMRDMHMPDMLMPGMLTDQEMARLAAAKGPEFDRLFLEGMIKHHGGALTMVKDLLATPGAGQDAEIFAFASDVDADQRMEIDRMSDMLKELK
jgi:uncharacterized protein (DUF305 family)